MAIRPEGRGVMGGNGTTNPGGQEETTAPASEAAGLELGPGRGPCVRVRKAGLTEATWNHMTSTASLTTPRL